MELSHRHQRYLVEALREAHGRQFKWRVVGERVGLSHEEIDRVVEWLTRKQLIGDLTVDNEASLTPQGRELAEQFVSEFQPPVEAGSPVASPESTVAAPVTAPRPAADVRPKDPITALPVKDVPVEQNYAGLLLWAGITLVLLVFFYWLIHSHGAG